MSKEHYTDGRRWSYLRSAWIFEDAWNDKEQIALLEARNAELLKDMRRMAEALRFVQHRDSRWHDDDVVTPALREYERKYPREGV